jgi:hypothetical protein
MERGTLVCELTEIVKGAIRSGQSFEEIDTAAFATYPTLARPFVRDALAEAYDKAGTDLRAEADELCRFGDRKFGDDGPGLLRAKLTATRERLVHADVKARAVMREAIERFPQLVKEFPEFAPNNE